MFQGLLPGLRQIRTPLIVGGLYMFAVWLIVGPQYLGFSINGDSPAEKRVEAAVDALGPGIMLGIAAGFAVLVGSLLIVPRSPFWSTSEGYGESESGSEFTREDLGNWLLDRLAPVRQLKYSTWLNDPRPPRGLEGERGAILANPTRANRGAERRWRDCG